MNNYSKRRATITRKAREAARAGIAGNPYLRADDRGLFAAVYKHELEILAARAAAGAEVAIEFLPDDMTRDEEDAIDVVAIDQHSFFASLDAAEAFLRAHFANWFIYRGGSHIALHRTPGSDSPRVLIVTELSRVAQ